MKKLILMMAVFLGIFSLSACGNPALVKTKAGNITQQDLYKELKSEYGNQVVQTLVYKKLLESKYTVTKKEIDAKVASIQSGLGGSAQLQKALAQNNMTMTQFKDNVKMQLLLLKAETAGIKVTDQDLQTYFNNNKSKYVEVQVRHILVDKLSTAQDIEKQLKNGADFATLAKKYSTDTGSKSKGGEIGWVKNDGTYVAAFTNAALKLKKGEISAPVKSQYGYHIIKAEAVKNQLSDFKSQVKQDYLQSKAKSQQVVLNELIKNGNIKVNDSQFKSLFKIQPVQPATPSTSGSGSSSSTPSTSGSSSTTSK